MSKYIKKLANWILRSSNLVIQLLSWFWRAWPILIIVFLAMLHFFVFKIFDIENNQVNKVISAFFQIGGGLIVLISINNNMGIFKGRNLVQIVGKFFSDFPFFRRCPVEEKPELMAKAVIGFSATISSKRKCATLEEWVEEFQRQIEECRKLMDENEKFFRSSIDSLKESLNKKFLEINGKVDVINQSLTRSFVGGMKAQFFGVLLVIYGSIVSVL